ncbi:MAG: hypothetical protein AAGJ29_03480 [Pseudomonadota bacterium]
MDLVPTFDKNAAYIWVVFALAGLSLGLTGLFVVVRARAAKRALDQLPPKPGSPDT